MAARNGVQGFNSGGDAILAHGIKTSLAGLQRIVAALSKGYSLQREADAAQSESDLGSARENVSVFLEEIKPIRDDRKITEPRFAIQSRKPGTAGPPGSGTSTGSCRQDPRRIRNSEDEKIRGHAYSP